MAQDLTIQLFWSQVRRGELVRAPARRITGFEERAEFPGRADRREFDIELHAKDARAMDELTMGGLKLGGWPDWIQYTEWPSAHATLLLQLDASVVEFGDVGLGHLMLDAKRLAFTWQST